jgi:uncharacterized heparinase superfamily protein
MSAWQQVSLYWHTLRYLRPVQFYGRLWFLLFQPKPNLRSAPLRALPYGLWQIPARRLVSMTGPQSWVFLNKAGHLAEIGWDGPQREKLWRYNQHYFDDLNALGAPNRRKWHITLIRNWMVNHPPSAGTGWEPYPLSLRVVNWIKWSLGGGELSREAEHSLAVQVRWLIGRLENHLLGNHLFANAKALVMAGLYFDGPEADEWLAKGLRILAHEVPEQFLSDGGHFERSTMYHSLVLEDMLDLVNVTRCFVNRLSLSQRQQTANWPQLAYCMYAWLQAICHPDKEISFFNDAAFDVAPSLEELGAYVRKVLVDVKPTQTQSSSILHLKDSGYVRLNYDSTVALLDVAPVGPDYLPGHAHADTLSFELSVAGRRVLVNSGTSCYGTSVERLRQRGTAAHNTVVVDGKDSSEVWASFRVARRAYPGSLQIEFLADTGATKVSCAHNGYTRLRGNPIHHRTWLMDKRSLTVIDRIEGLHQTAEARFHFHPEINVQIELNQAKGSALLLDGILFSWYAEHGKARLESSTWHPRFGQSLENQCLVVKLVDGMSTLHFCWAPGVPEFPID